MPPHAPPTCRGGVLWEPGSRKPTNHEPVICATAKTSPARACVFLVGEGQCTIIGVDQASQVPKGLAGPRREAAPRGEEP